MTKPGRGRRPSGRGLSQLPQDESNSPAGFPHLSSVPAPFPAVGAREQVGAHLARAGGGVRTRGKLQLEEAFMFLGPAISGPVLKGRSQ